VEVIPSKEVRLVTVSQAVMVVREVSQVVMAFKEVSQVATVLRVCSQEITEVRLVKVFTVIVVGTVKGRKVATSSRWSVVDTAPSLQEHTGNLEVTRSKAADQATHHRRVDTTSSPVDIQVVEPMGSS